MPKTTRPPTRRPQPRGDPGIARPKRRPPTVIASTDFDTELAATATRMAIAATSASGPPASRVIDSVIASTSASPATAARTMLPAPPSVFADDAGEDEDGREQEPRSRARSGVRTGSAPPPRSLLPPVGARRSVWLRIERRDRRDQRRRRRAPGRPPRSRPAPNSDHHDDHPREHHCRGGKGARQVRPPQRRRRPRPPGEVERHRGRGDQPAGGSGDQRARSASPATLVAT